MNKFFLSKKFAVTMAFVLLAALAIFILSACNTDTMLIRAAKDATNYSITAIYNDDTKMLYASQTVDYRNSSGQTINSLYFHLHPNAYREDAVHRPVNELQKERAYPNGFSEGTIIVKDTKINGKTANSVVGGKDKNLLIVTLPAPLYENSRISVAFDFDLKIPNMLHRLGYTENSINLGNFYPIVSASENGIFNTEVYSSNGDPFFSEIANYNVSITAPSNFIVASTGNLVKTEATDLNKTTHVYKAQAVRDFAISMSPKFEVIEGKVENTSIKYFYYKDEHSQISLQTALDAVRTFNKIIGTYPYQTLSVVETGFLHGGMEYPNIVYISDAIASDTEYRNVIIHEIAHQWWYGIVGTNQNRDAWIDEGLAEFSTAVFYEQNPSYGIEKKEPVRDALRSYLLFVEVYGDVFDKLDTSMTRLLTAYGTEPEYVYMAYVKSLLMYDSLRELIGDKKFFNGLQTFYKLNAMGIATRESIVLAFEKESNIPLKNFFDSWLDGKIVIQNNN